ncbi:MAG: DUF551 domain-containing protein [Acidobacteria bacterium]|nr:DUF551 domain-containing protein [Acidobacteriota bacterium]
MHMQWQPIESAPKDGRAVLLLSRPYTTFSFEEAIHYPAKVAIGYWDPAGSSWVHEFGARVLAGVSSGAGQGETVTLAQTGVWLSGGGWFQPDEVTHWMQLPAAPE